MKRILLGLGAALLFVSCGQPTTYGQAIQQQKRAALETPADENRRAPPSSDVAMPDCPTLAREGSRDYAYCEKLLQEQQGIGGSGPATVDTPPEADDPNVKYWRDADDQ